MLQLLCADVSVSGGLGVASSEDGKLWVWDADSGETRVSCLKRVFSLLSLTSTWQSIVCGMCYLY